MEVPDKDLEHLLMLAQQGLRAIEKYSRHKLAGADIRICKHYRDRLDGINLEFQIPDEPV